MSERYLTRKEAAELLRRRPQTLRVWAMRGVGPPYIRVNGLALYPEAALRGWLEERRVKPDAGAPR